MLEITPIPLLVDNYAYFLEDTVTGTCAVVDPSQGEGVLGFLQKREKSLHYILNTHHHWDHVGGNLLIKSVTNAQVVGFSEDSHRIPGIDIALKEGDLFPIGRHIAQILFIPGHTLGHIAYYFEDVSAVFTGDTLFSLGCGRLFEGTPEQMWNSLMLLANLPDETRVYCGHEYTLANLAFAKSLRPHDNELMLLEKELEEKRYQNIPTIPSFIGFEKQYNPFLGCQDALSFAKIRALKDVF